jgi:hypothetical protein
MNFARLLEEKIEKAIREEDSEEGLYFCEGCEKKTKWNQIRWR